MYEFITGYINDRVSYDQFLDTQLENQESTFLIEIPDANNTSMIPLEISCNFDLFNGLIDNISNISIDGLAVSEEHIIDLLNYPEDTKSMILHSLKNLRFFDELKHGEESSQYRTTENLWEYLQSFTRDQAYTVQESLAVDGVQGFALSANMNAPAGNNKFHSFHHSVWPLMTHTEDSTPDIPLVVVQFPEESGGSFSTNDLLSGNTPNSDLVEFIQKQNLIILHPFEYELHKKEIKELGGESIGGLKSLPSISRRTLSLVSHNERIKTSLPDVMFTARTRELGPSDMVTSIVNTAIMEQMAEKDLLPSNVWVIPEVTSTFHNNGNNLLQTVIRGGMTDAISNNDKKIPESCYAISLSSLGSTSLFTPDISLVEHVINTGWDAKKIFKELSTHMINASYDFMVTGIHPEMHGQNCNAVLDPQSKSVIGLVLSDNGDALTNPSKLKEHGIDPDKMYEKSPDVFKTDGTFPHKKRLHTDESSETYGACLSRKHHYTIFDLSLLPIAKRLIKAGHLTAEETKSIIQETQANWWLENSQHAEMATILEPDLTHRLIEYSTGLTTPLEDDSVIDCVEGYKLRRTPQSVSISKEQAMSLGSLARGNAITVQSLEAA